MPGGILRAIARQTKIPARVLAVLMSAVAVLAAAVVGFSVVTHAVTSPSRIGTSDPRHLTWFTAYRRGVFADLAHVATEMGATKILLPLAVVAGALLWRRGVRLALAVAPLGALVTAGTATFLIKEAIGRPAPGTAGWHTPSATSFPSGHAAGSTAFFVALSIIIAIAAARRPLTRLAVIMLGFSVPAAVGISRLVLGTHWPSDVLGGWGLGCAVAMACVLAAIGLRPVNLARQTVDSLLYADRSAANGR